jgi:hypothetical protein
MKNNFYVKSGYMHNISNRPQIKSLYYYVFLFNLIICIVTCVESNHCFIIFTEWWWQLFITSLSKYTHFFLFICWWHQIFSFPFCFSLLVFPTLQWHIYIICSRENHHEKKNSRYDSTTTYPNIVKKNKCSKENTLHYA